MPLVVFAKQTPHVKPLLAHKHKSTRVTRKKRKLGACELNWSLGLHRVFKREYTKHLSFGWHLEENACLSHPTVCVPGKTKLEHRPSRMLHHQSAAAYQKYYLPGGSVMTERRPGAGYCSQWHPASIFDEMIKPSRAKGATIQSDLE